MSNEKNVDKSELAKKPLGFLFLGANVLILIGCAITMTLYKTGDVGLIYLPTLICNLLALVLAGLFGYFEVKDFAPQIMHFQRKGLKLYVAAFSVFIVAILFNVLYFLFFLNQLQPKYLQSHFLGGELGVYFGITAFLTLVSIGLQRYGNFRITLDIYRRRHGQNPNKPDEKTKDIKTDAKLTKNDKKTNNKKSTKSGASSGLLDQM